jgi:ribosomal protein S12 methylthiotransferase accessory factor YcaO
LPKTSAADRAFWYGTASSDRVAVNALFESDPTIRVARTGLRFSEPQSGADFTEFGSAVGLSEHDVRVRAFGELVERAEWARTPYSTHLTILPAEGGRSSFGEESCAWCGRQDEGLVVGTSLVTGLPRAVPVRLVFQRWPGGPEREPGARVDATGVAAARSRAVAIRRGLLEVVERHTALQVWRVGGDPATIVPPSTLGHVLSGALRRLGLRALLIQTGRVGLPPTCLAVLIDRAGRSTVGTACGRRLSFRSATFEALALRRSVMRGANEERSAGLSRVAAAFWSPGTTEQFERIASAASPLGGVLKDRPLPSLRTLASEIGAAFDGDPIVVELTTERGRAVGWSVVRVVIPGVARRECFDRHGPSRSGSPRMPGTRDGTWQPEPHPFG